MYAPSSPNSLARTALSPPVRFIPPPSYADLPAVKQEDPTAGEPILIDSRSQTPEPRSNADSRDRLFAALELGDYTLRKPRSITTSDDLDDAELKRCFEILHACGLATDENSTRAETRDTMEGFLNAVFKEWAGDFGEPAKPSMDFVVREHISVGNICSQPANHRTSALCVDISACHTPVFGIATYRSRPAQLSISFSTEEPQHSSKQELQDLFCPMERADVRWEEQNWMAHLRQSMKRACMVKVHKYNKHLAIWYVRCLVVGWAKGSIWMGKDVEVYSFVSKDAVDAAFAMMGDA
ncbi:hypothetical protein F53441_14124 [Fusarium austroafricanum]|uniref:Uncharacterized protein n=1 Tax=Fusarium austroafricanum TaxID=2364996 RepID=A0A8H4NEP9_9HYPO|nr:hypothetical protein F53441_14124 [Fusarium austroafricanum]